MIRRRLLVPLATLLLTTSACVSRTWGLFPRDENECTPGEEGCTTPETGCGSGLGTLDRPYIVCTPEELVARTAGGDGLAADVQLGADIDLGGSPWTPIGTATSPYRGWFDGVGHTISGLLVDVPNANGAGLFGNIADARIAHVILAAPDIRAGGESVGALVGAAESSTLEDVHVIGGTVVGSSTSVKSYGGLLGFMNDSRAFDVSSSATVSIADGTACSGVGGLVGATSRSTVLRGAARGSVNATGAFAVGGLVGSCFGQLDSGLSPWMPSSSWGGVMASYAEGSVLGGSQVGGLVGDAAGFCDLMDSSSQGSVTGTTSVGGLVGRKQSTPLLLRSYAYGGVSGSTEVGGLAGTAADAGDFDGAFWNAEANAALQGLGSLADPLEVVGASVLDFATAATFAAQAWRFGSTWEMLAAVDARFPVQSWRGDFCAGKQGALAYNAYGTGSLTDPFRICTPAQLTSIASATVDFDKAFVLLADLDLSGHSATPIGSRATPFTGIFLGQFHRISNLALETSGQTDVGLFGVTDGARLWNIEIAGPNIASDADHVGALVGWARNSSITYISVTGGSAHTSITLAGASGVGGIVGRATDSGLAFVWSDVLVVAHAGATGAGGIAGIFDSAVSASPTLVYALMDGDVQALDASNVGGIVGQLDAGLLVAAGVKGTVVGSGTTQNTGGVVGSATPTTTVRSTYVQQQVSGSGSVGGIAGRCDGCLLTNGYVHASIAGTSGVGAVVGTVVGAGAWNDILWSTLAAATVEYAGPGINAQLGALPEAQMLQATTYTAAGWNTFGFGTYAEWRIADGQLPHHRWEQDRRASLLEVW